ncbi:hypothetical protein DFH06DRAFT_1473274 [Mycena polygramma]|nr:hypothetical protein DFH06DRAFT_1473274 [Mycena polygramma]
MANPSEGSGPQIGGLRVEYAVHPDFKKFHKSYSTPSKDIRDKRAQVKEACAACLKIAERGVLSRCATVVKFLSIRPVLIALLQCKCVLYCSKACQKADWPRHKQVCGPSNSDGDKPNIMKIGQTFVASDFIHIHIQLCFIMAFDLLRQPQLDKPFIARIDIGVEPADVREFFNIYTGQFPPGYVPGTFPGMVQVNGFTPLPDDNYIGEKFLSIWRATKESVNAYRELENCPVGLLVVSKATAIFNVIPIVIRQSAMDLMRSRPSLAEISAITGAKKVVPIDIGGCLELINKHIRADDKNKPSLRLTMSPDDIQIICDAASGNVGPARSSNWYNFTPHPQLGAALLKEKMARETLYKPALMFSS